MIMSKYSLRNETALTGWRWPPPRHENSLRDAHFAERTQKPFIFNGRISGHREFSKEPRKF